MFEYLCNSIIFATTDSQDMIKWKGVKFLKFVGAKPSDSEKDFEDAFIRRLQESIREVKASREMGARYMTFQELLKDERAAGKAEGKAEEVLEFLREVGTVSNDLKMCIMAETDLERLKKWVKLVARSASLDEFINKMKE